ncbi:MAG: ADP-forming succinate--CoA ligase subunit beta [Parachlamydia sp.]|jgi:succinyl-CoA synthetase beta subunit|nr:ADP-forming succinate--CoA ligase subunit beta [Parachlamydia sp.]
MNLHEYQAKNILLQYQIPTPPYLVVSSIEEVEEFLKKGWNSAVLKIQIHAGGRGKAGGVRLLQGKEEILKGARELLGMKVVNEQTGPEGLIVRELLVTEPVQIAHEYYLGLTIDRQSAARMLIASPVGGVEIEKTAKETPDRVLFLPVPFEGRLRSYQLLRLAKFMGWDKAAAVQGGEIVQKMIQAFIECDASLLEINPLVTTDGGDLVALDAKMSIDDNALYRQSALKNLFDPSQVSSSEARAQEFDLSYVALDGEIGCMVNGAGLAMATMDLVQAHGGKPANFLDVGGGASVEKVAEGFKIILSDPHVKAILINIFGGIMNCETLALGIIEAASRQHIPVPLIVRMEGTNVEKGKELLAGSGLNIQIAADLTEAAKLAVEAK